MSKTIIISVGTSVLTNHSKLKEYKDDEYVKSLLRGFEKGIIDEDFKEFSKKEIAIRLNDLSDKLDDSYDGMDDKKGILFTSAEIHSLYKYYQIEENMPLNGEKDKIILLCTDTPDSLFSAQIIRDEVLTKWDFFKEKCEMETDNNFVDENGIKTIKGLNFKDINNWIKTDNNQLSDDCGLGRLRQFFRDLVEKINKNDLLIIRTGGFKEFSADLKLFSFSHKIKSLYLFEDSLQFIEVIPESASGDFIYQAFIK